MITAKPKPILIVTVLLIMLALLSTTSTLTSRLGFARRPVTANGAGGNFQAGNNAAGGNAQGGNNATGGGNFQGGNNPAGGGGNFAGRGGFNTFTIFRTLGLNGQFIGYFNLGTTILGILLALLSAFGVWRQKRWGLNLAMIMAIVFLIGAVPAVFSFGGRNVNLLRESITILSILASIPILVYGILPSIRDLVS